MERILSFGLGELAFLAGVIGLVLLVGVVVVAVVAVVKKQRGSTQAAGLDGANVPAQSPRRSWIWIVLVVLSVLVLVPLCVAVGGVLLVTPAERTIVRDAGLEPEVYVVEQGEPIATLSPAMTEPLGTLSPGAQSSGAAEPAFTPPGRSTLLSLNPFNPVTFVTLLGLAGLVLLLGVAVVAVVGKGWKGIDEPPGVIQVNEDSQESWFRAAKLRSVLLALVLWIALSAYLILDLVFQVSLYWQFVVMYMAFWVLAGGLLAIGSPLRDKFLILGLFVLVLGSVRFVDWNSRKSFLKDFYSLQEGMTAVEVDQTMSGYMKQYGGSPLHSQDRYEFDEQGALVTGWVTYQHTNEGWGDSDWGVVAFENGHVTQFEFLPDEGQPGISSPDLFHTVEAIEPAVTISPTSGPSGTLVQVVASGFPPITSVSVAVGPANSEFSQAAQGTTDANGAFVVQVPVEGAPGMSLVFAVAVEGQPGISSPDLFHIVEASEPAVTISPTSGPSGTLVQVVASGFPPITSVSVAVGPANSEFSQAAQGTTDANGAFVVQVPAEGAPGMSLVFAVAVEGQPGISSPDLFQITGAVPTALPAPSPLPTPSPTPYQDMWITFLSPAYAVSLQYPADWQPVPGYGSPETGETRFAAINGFFQINAMDADSIDQATAAEAGHKLQPYGSQPTIETLQVQGQEARLILPSDDQPAGMQNQAAIIIRYPQPVNVVGTLCRYFVLWADSPHIRTFAQTLRFTN